MILKQAGAKEGTKKTFKEFKAPIKRAASETIVRKGDMILTNKTVRLNFSISCLKEGANIDVSSGAKIIVRPVIIPVINRRTKNRDHKRDLL